MESVQPLEEVLAGKEPEVVEPEAAEETTEAAEPEKVEAVEEDESGAEVEAAEPEPKGVEEPEPPSGEKSNDVPIAALLDERDKRKALQAELEELKKVSEKAEEPIDFWENPQAALQHMEQKFEEKLTQKEQEFANLRLADSITAASYRNKDYDNYREAFTRAAEQNPALVDQALQSIDPGQYIYDTGKQFATFDEAGGDIDSLKERLRQEIMEELASKDKAKEDKLAAVPDSLTTQTSASAPRDKVEGGPTPLENIFGHNDR